MKLALKWLRLILTQPSDALAWLFGEHPIKFVVLLLCAFIWALWLLVSLDRDRIPVLPPGVVTVIPRSRHWTGLYRFTDVDAGVTCWESTTGLSCLRDRP